MGGYHKRRCTDFGWLRLACREKTGDLILNGFSIGLKVRRVESVVMGFRIRRIVVERDSAAERGGR